MDLKFVYGKGLLYDVNKQNLLTNVCKSVSTLLDLPNFLILEFNNLPENNYGETILDSRIKNRVRLNSNLNYKETIFVLSHELIHLSQIHTGLLSYNQKGEYVWEGKVYCNYVQLRQMPYNDYQNLPWELDVVKKQQKILDHLLKN